jgi:hypothetical protein
MINLEDRVVILYEVFSLSSLLYYYLLRQIFLIFSSELLATNHEVPGSIPGSTMGIFLVGGGSPW